MYLNSKKGILEEYFMKGTLWKIKHNEWYQINWWSLFSNYNTQMADSKYHLINDKIFSISTKTSHSQTGKNLLRTDKIFFAR